MNNFTAAIELLVALLTQASRVSLLLQTAKAEDRDISMDEWRALLAENNTARDRLVDAIITAKGNTP